MPPKSRKEYEDAIKALQAEMDSAEPDEEVWVEDPSGTRVRLTGKRASSVLGRFAHLFEDESDQGEPAGDDDGDESDAKPAGGGYFAKRAKK